MDLTFTSSIHQQFHWKHKYLPHEHGDWESTLYLSLNVRASGLAQKGNQFYIAYYANGKMRAEVGGEKTILPEP